MSDTDDIDDTTVSVDNTQPRPLTLRVFALVCAFTLPVCAAAFGWAWSHFDAAVDGINYRMGNLRTLTESAAACPTLVEESRVNEIRIKALQDQIEAMAEVADECSAILAEDTKPEGHVGQDNGG